MIFLRSRSQIITEFTYGRMAPTYRYLALVFEEHDSYIGKLVSKLYFNFNSNDFALFTIYSFPRNERNFRKEKEKVNCIQHHISSKFSESF